MSKSMYFLLSALAVLLAGSLSLLLLAGGKAEVSSASISLSTGERSDESSSAQTADSDKESGTSSASAPESEPEAPEMRAVWLSFYDWLAFTTGTDEAGFRTAFADICDTAADFGLNTLIVQVRAFDDAMYPSRYFPWSQYASGTLGQDPGYDPLAQMVTVAHEKGLSLHAWINPYRIRSGSSEPLQDGYAAAEWSRADNGNVLPWQNGLYYNPSVPAVQQLILDGVAEILDGYAVDGIHFDDYFYPTADPSFDLASYELYQKAGGQLSQMAWREENVNRLVKEVHSIVEADGKGRQFGISPAGNLAYNANTLSADVALWCRESGYVDYICPQLYFGFENSTVPFAEAASQWSRMVTAEDVSLYVGLAPYKIGALDKWAGDGETEWLEHQDVLLRQLETLRSLPNCGGFALFRYASLFTPDPAVQEAVEAEAAAFRSALLEEPES